MYSRTLMSIASNSLNQSFVWELFVESNSMTKVNITLDTTLHFKIPTILLVLIVNYTSVSLFRSLESNFVYKMIIYDSINNILYAIVLFYGHNFKHQFSFAPFCGISVAFSYGILTFNRLVPLIIVLYR